MSFRRWYRRYRTLWVSLLACSAFLALAIYGWGVTWSDILTGLWVSGVLLMGLILLAAVVGFVVYKLRQWLGGDLRGDRPDPQPGSQSTPQQPQTGKPTSASNGTEQPQGER